MATSAFSQNVDKPGEPYECYSVIELWEIKNECYNAKVTVSDIVKEVYLLDENGEKVVFTSSPDAITYMAKRGWTFVQQLSSGGFAQKHFLMKKTVKDDKEAMKNLKTEEKKK